MDTQIEVVPFRPELKKEWQQFVDYSNNGTIFHSIDFFDYHPSERFQFHHLMFYKKGILIAVLPGGFSDSVYKSPLGASFGGFVVKGFLPLADANAIVSAFILYITKLSAQKVIITPPMGVYESIPDDSIAYALIYNGFTYSNPLFSSVIDTRFVKTKEDLDCKIRYNINKAIRSGVTVVEGNDFEKIYPVFLKNKEKFGIKPTHSLDELQKLDNLLPGKLKLLTAYYEDKPIAGLLLFLTNKNCALIFYNLHLYEHHKLYATSILVEHSIRWCYENGFRYLDYGVSADTFSSNPLEPSWPLVDFKESLGCMGVIRKSYTLQLEQNT